MSIAASIKSPCSSAWVMAAISEELVAALTAMTAAQALKRELKRIVLTGIFGQFSVRFSSWSFRLDLPGERGLEFFRSKMATTLYLYKYVNGDFDGNCAVARRLLGVRAERERNRKPSPGRIPPHCSSALNPTGPHKETPPFNCYMWWNRASLPRIGSFKTNDDPPPKTCVGTCLRTLSAHNLHKKDAVRFSVLNHFRQLERNPTHIQGDKTLREPQSHSRYHV